MPRRNCISKAIFDVVFYDKGIVYIGYLCIPFFATSYLESVLVDSQLIEKERKYKFPTASLVGRVTK